MKLRIKETGEIKELLINDENGIEWTNTLIAAENLWNSGTKEYEISEEDYNNWKEYIENYLSDIEEIKELAEELGIDEEIIYNEVKRELDFDMNEDHEARQNTIRRIRNDATLKELKEELLGNQFNIIDFNNRVLEILGLQNTEIYSIHNYDIDEEVSEVINFTYPLDFDKNNDPVNDVGFMLEVISKTNNKFDTVLGVAHIDIM